MKPHPSRTIRLIIEYDGTHYHGWQIQKSKVTVQETVAGAIRKVTGEAATLYGAGRTDAGVHAEGQTAHFRTRSRISVEKLLPALNAHLPEDIAVRKAEEVAAGFHAQFDAAGKTYRYTIVNRPARAALLRNRAHLVRPPLDLDAMRRAAERLTGEHDFRAFGSEMSRKKNTVRKIDAIDVARDGEIVTVTVRGGGFLYNMVRAIVGTLLWVGLGKIPPERVVEILQSRDRSEAGPNVPAKGLCLVAVHYEESKV